jgi:four helix bundle protein
MTRPAESPIFSKTYDLMACLLRALTAFPKDQRFRLAARIEAALFAFQEAILRAVRSRSRRRYLLEADLELEKLRLCLRLAQDLECLDFKHYEEASRQVNEIGRLLGGWLKTVPAFPAGADETALAERGEGSVLAGR